MKHLNKQQTPTSSVTSEIVFFSADKMISSEMIEIKNLKVKGDTEYEDVIDLATWLYYMHYPSDEWDIEFVMYLENGIDSRPRVHALVDPGMFMRKEEIYHNVHKGHALERFSIQFMETGFKGNAGKLLSRNVFELEVHSQTPFRAVYEVGMLLRTMCGLHLELGQIDRVVFKHEQYGELNEVRMFTLAELSEKQGFLQDAEELFLPGYHPSEKQFY